MGKNRYALKHPQTVISIVAAYSCHLCRFLPGRGSAYQRRMARCRQRRRWHVCSRSTRMPLPLMCCESRVVVRDGIEDPKEKEEIRQLLKLCDQDFVPPLSHRNSTSQTNWPRQKKRRMELQNIWRISAVSMWCCGRKRESCGPL